tara:strand:+ start:200 stop:523 length:324 start_codon:yes stop_codon:yes gene_type:complete
MEKTDYLKPHKSEGKWVKTCDYHEKYSPEVWVVTSDFDPFDIPIELADFKEDWDYTMLREDVKKVSSLNKGRTNVFVYSDESYTYVIHETRDGHGYIESYAVTRVAR